MNSINEKHPDKMKKILKGNLIFYENHARNLPWRQTKNPYKIWISEIMLQQTQVITVIERYKRFLKRFPTLKKLAQSTESEVCDEWAGLGYYSRARNLRMGAGQIMKEFNGEFPQNEKDLLSIKGIGPYTAGAILSFAFGISSPIVDGNVERIFSRIFNIEGDLKKNPNKNQVWDLSRQYIEQCSAGRDVNLANQALMEMGALSCRPKKPNCLNVTSNLSPCPHEHYCEAYKNEKVLSLPTPKKKVQVQEKFSTLILFKVKKNLAIFQRPNKGLWNNLWEPFHIIDSKKNISKPNFAKEQLGSFKHRLTHRLFLCNVYLVELNSKNDLEKFIEKEKVFYQSQKWMTIKNLQKSQNGFSKLALKSFSFLSSAN